jgi:hypothetical protein
MTFYSFLCNIGAEPTTFDTVLRAAEDLDPEAIALSLKEYPWRAPTPPPESDGMDSDIEGDGEGSEEGSEQFNRDGDGGKMEDVDMDVCHRDIENWRLSVLPDA